MSHESSDETRERGQVTSISKRGPTTPPRPIGAVESSRMGKVRPMSELEDVNG